MSVGNGRQARQNSIAESSLVYGEVRFVLLSLVGRLGCTERSVRLARTTITSTPRSVNDVEVRSISNLLGDYCQYRISSKNSALLK